MIGDWADLTRDRGVGGGQLIMGDEYMDIDYPIQNNIFNLTRAIVEVAVLLFFLFFLLLVVLDSYANK